MHDDLPQSNTRQYPDSLRLLAEPGRADPTLPSTGKSSSRKPVVIIAAAVCLALVAAGVVLAAVLYNHPQSAATLRDVFLVVLGIQSMIINLLLIAVLAVLIYVALKVYDLTQFVQSELRPIVRRADDMVRTMHSRTVYISDTAVKPVIEVVSFMAAVKSIIRSFTRPVH
jgi:hypothetical protein